MSAWKPRRGDVGVNAAYGYRGIYIGGYCDAHQRTGCWHNESGLADPGDDVRRPLVVIDPEDREQVERLAKAMHESDHIAPWHDLHNETRSQIEDAMQAALREFATPKPDEPQGLGAVVESDGSRWVSLGESRWLEVPADRLVEARRWYWSEFPAAVRVLSGGVS